MNHPKEKLNIEASKLWKENIINQYLRLHIVVIEVWERGIRQIKRLISPETTKDDDRNYKGQWQSYKNIHCIDKRRKEQILH